MSRFYVRPEDVKGNDILVLGKEAHHIVDVMRMAKGDAIVAFDGTGREYIGKILNVSKCRDGFETRPYLRIKIEKINSIKKENKISVTLAQSLPKKAKMDFIIEKATELGVDEIIPLVTERTIVHLAKDKQLQKGKHWQEVAIGASKQCGRLDVPKIDPAIKFKDVLKEVKNYDMALMACLNEKTRPLKEIISNFSLPVRQAGKRIFIMVGPEGDFSPREIETAESMSVKLVSLGRLVLRVDTAAVFLLSALNYENSI